LSAFTHLSSQPQREGYLLQCVIPFCRPFSSVARLPSVIPFPESRGFPPLKVFPFTFFWFRKVVPPFILCFLASGYVLCERKLYWSPSHMGSPFRSFWSLSEGPPFFNSFQATWSRIPYLKIRPFSLSFSLLHCIFFSPLDLLDLFFLSDVT